MKRMQPSRPINLFCFMNFQTNYKSNFRIVWNSKANVKTIKWIVAVREDIKEAGRHKRSSRHLCTLCDSTEPLCNYGWKTLYIDKWKKFLSAVVVWCLRYAFCAGRFTTNLCVGLLFVKLPLLRPLRTDLVLSTVDWIFSLIILICIQSKLDILSVKEV